MLVGIAASVGIMLIGDTFGVLRGTTTDGFHWMRLAALGIIAGFTGHSLLSGLAEKLSDIAKKQVDKQFEEKQGKLLDLSAALNEADRLLDQKQCESAKVAYENVENRFPEQRLRAQKGVANCLAYLGKYRDSDQHLREAERLLEKLDGEFPNNADVVYNLMWVQFLIDNWEQNHNRNPKTYSVDQLRVVLTRAISLDPESKRWAKLQRDLRPIFVREASIAEIVGGVPPDPPRFKYRDGDQFYHLPACTRAQEGGGWIEVEETPVGVAPCRECLP